MNSPMFELVKSWHQSTPSVWNKQMVSETAVSIGWISQAEASEIIGG